MKANFTSSGAGDASPIYGYPGAYMPQYGLRSAMLAPPPEKIAPGLAKWLPFRFENVPARGTIQASMAFEWPFQLLTMTGHDTDTSVGGSSAGYQLYLLHESPQGVRPLTFRPALLDANIVGTAEFPSMLHMPYLFDKGETLQVEVRNLSTVAVSIIQVLLGGVMVDETAMMRYPTTGGAF